MTNNRKSNFRHFYTPEKTEWKDMEKLRTAARLLKEWVTANKEEFQGHDEAALCIRRSENDFIAFREGEYGTITNMDMEYGRSLLSERMLEESADDGQKMLEESASYD